MSDDLDNASVKRLNATLEAMRAENASLREENRVLRKLGEAREDMNRTALNRNAAALEEHDKRLAARERSNDGLVKIVREVMGEERKVVGTLTEGIKRIDDSVKIVTAAKAEPAEITGPQLRRWAIKHALPWLAARGFFVKLFAALAAAAGAAWAWLTHRH